MTTSSDISYWGHGFLQPTLLLVSFVTWQAGKICPIAGDRWRYLYTHYGVQEDAYCTGYTDCTGAWYSSPLVSLPFHLFIRGSAKLLLLLLTWNKDE